jgi:Phage integrase, N-terminal SAM-like domain
VSKATFVRAEARERQRYPDYLMPIAGLLSPADEQFADLREELLLGYNYPTARAYRADLDDIYLWATRRGFNVREVTNGQLRQYVALLRRRRYSQSTIRRRLTAFNAFQRLVRDREGTPAIRTEELPEGRRGVAESPSTETVDVGNSEHGEPRSISTSGKP